MALMATSHLHPLPTEYSSCSPACCSHFSMIIIMEQMLTVWGLQADPNSLIVLKKKKINNEDLLLCVCLYIAGYISVQEESKAIDNMEHDRC